MLVNVGNVTSGKTVTPVTRLGRDAEDAYTAHAGIRKKKKKKNNKPGMMLRGSKIQ